ncbi:MAG: hypothetical protein MZW92_64740 [Comamonadaceae bacterium]|nr:hypothetical protein [Comamonadaceae bacterium]
MDAEYRIVAANAAYRARLRQRPADPGPPLLRGVAPLRPCPATRRANPAR